MTTIKSHDYIRRLMANAVYDGVQKKVDTLHGPSDNVKEILTHLNHVASMAI